ncbi:high affinity immunoglobulin epsilon receptor subunit beta-like [Engystomops pustulosus]|uniref:high affinity immunoglobulin epsilon receptor subunit beta-like n=1 Tax=Engystomops pustulosus TaxID=76066 RepID=UPI003AFB17C9
MGAASSRHRVGKSFNKKWEGIWLYILLITKGTVSSCRCSPNAWYKVSNKLRLETMDYQPTNDVSAMSLTVEQVNTPAFYETFLKGHPKAQGAIQIVLAFVQSFTGTVFLYTLTAYTSVTVQSFICYWGAAFYLISGSVTVAAANKCSRNLVKGALGMNVVSTLIAVSETALVIVDFSHKNYIYGPCVTSPCSLFQDTILIIRLITIIHLLFIMCLQLSSCLVTCKFSVLSLKQRTPNIAQNSH